MKGKPDSRTTSTPLILGVALMSLLLQAVHITAQQYTTTETGFQQTFGCNNGSCSLVGVQTETLPGMTTTSTFVQGGQTYTEVVIQSASTWTNSVGITITQTTDQKQMEPVIGLRIIFAFLVVAVILVFSLYYAREKAKESVETKVEPPPSSISAERNSKQESRSRDTRICPNCGFDNPPFARAFCVKCGEGLERNS
jgi:hypothetical protein